METSQMKVGQTQWQSPIYTLDPAALESGTTPSLAPKITYSSRQLYTGTLGGHLPFIICCSSICKVWMAREGSSLAERLTRWMESFPSATAAISSSSKKMTRLVCSMMALKGRKKKDIKGHVPLLKVTRQWWLALSHTWGLYHFRHDNDATVKRLTVESSCWWSPPTIILKPSLGLWDVWKHAISSVNIFS